MDGERICFKVALDPTVPVGSVIHSVAGQGVVYEPVILSGGETVREAIKAAAEKRAPALLVGKDGSYKLIPPEAMLAAGVEKPEARIEELGGSEVPVVEESSSVEEVVSLMIASGSSYVLIVDERGRPVALAGIGLLSRLVQEELDVEELRGAD